MIAAQDQVLSTVMKGSRLVRSEVPDARIVSPGVGVVHSRAGILLPGEQEPPSARLSMQLATVVWRENRWVVVAMENARVLSLAGMAALEGLPDEPLS
jgi:hypothetical protein